MQKLDIKDLLSELNPASDQPTSQKISSLTEQFLTSGKEKKVKEISNSQQMMMKRQSNYRATQEEMDKWVGVVKMNREKESLNFGKNEKDIARVNFFPNKPISDFHKKVNEQLTNLNLQSQKSVLKAQEKVLQKLDPEEAKKRLIEARKHRTMVFNEEIKRRRISKIKSKLYHKIKKRQKVREEGKRIDSMDAEERSEYVQKLTKKRIKERITLRHKTKNRHIQNLLRFNKNDTNQIQNSINEVNSLRKKELQRMNEQILENISEEYDDQNYREQAMKDLQNQIQELQKEENENQTKKGGLNAMKFMKLGKQRKINQQKSQAYKLLKQLQNGEQNEQMIQESQQNHQIVQQNGELTRKSFQNAKESKQTNNQTLNYLQRNINQYLNNSNNPELTKGINIEKLKQKYQPNRIDLNIEEVVSTHKDVFKSLTNEAAIQNMKEFQAQKHQEYENEVPAEKKQLKGWGNWTGPNFKQRKVDPQIEIKKKLAKIEEIKQKRKDGSMSHVIINESYNKNLKEYFVNKLPHEFKSPQQFDYLQNEVIGPQWNTMTQFNENIKSKVIVKKGQVIQPIKLPKNFQKKTK